MRRVNRKVLPKTDDSVRIKCSHGDVVAISGMEIAQWQSARTVPTRKRSRGNV